MTGRPRVLVAEDHKIVGEGLRSLLEKEFELVGLVENGKDLVAAALEEHPDVIVADITMPVLSGLEALRQIREAGEPAKLVFLTMHSDVTYAGRALDAGASGFVLKHAASSELITAIHEALAGRIYVTPAIAEELARDKRPRRGKRLTPRQRQVLRLIAAGRSAKEIADELGISSRTAEFHKYRMMEVLGIKTTAELIQYAVKEGLTSDS